jgi:transcriptional regulator with XRE-family HTH domain
MELSDRIKEERSKLNLSQDALASELHVSRQAISKWETSQSYPDLEKLIQLSDIFGITLDELVRGDKKLEKKLINDGGNKIRRISIFGCVLILLGILTVFWGGSLYPTSLRNEDFMSFLTSAFILITLGVYLIKDIHKGIIIGSLSLTLLVTIVYMASLKMNLWVLLMGVVVIIGFGGWLLTRIIDKKNDLN